VFVSELAFPEFIGRAMEVFELEVCTDKERGLNRRPHEGKLTGAG